MKLLRHIQGVKLTQKRTTSNVATQSIPPSSVITLPMQQHIGAPSIPVVQIGEHVDIGTLVGQIAGNVGANIYSSISGTVVDITQIKRADIQTQCVVIENDGYQSILPSVHPPQVQNYNDFIDALKLSGLVGLGGAGFPTYVKFSPKNLNQVDTLIVNAAECEPYITTDEREILEHKEDVFQGILAIKHYLSIKNIYIAIERASYTAMEVLFDLAKRDDDIHVFPLPSLYPQGAEKNLIYKVLGKQVPQGAIPADIGVLVSNVSTVAFVAKYLATGMPLVNRRITVTGGALKEAKNLEVPIGTSYADILLYCGINSPITKLIDGGPMMGKCMQNDQLPVIKTTNAILALSKKEVEMANPQNCIHCGRCVQSCPAGISPIQIMNAYTHRGNAELQHLYADLCIECGCCTYVCPAKIKVGWACSLAKKSVLTFIKEGN